MCRCYRDTKMEIQGLSDAQNTHYQHGAPRKSVSSLLATTPGTISSTVSKEDIDSASQGLRSDSNNNRRPGSSPSLLLAQNGSGPRLNLTNHKHDPADPPQPPRELCDLKEEYEDLELPADFVRAPELKYGEESEEDGVLQMALPLFEGEDGYGEQRQLLEEDLEQQQQQQQQDTNCNTDLTVSPSGASGSKSCEEFYVVFNIVQEENGIDKERRTRLCKVNGKKAPEPSRSSYGPRTESRPTGKVKPSPECGFDSLVNHLELAGESGDMVGGKRGLFEAESGDMMMSDGPEGGCDAGVSAKLPDVVMMNCSHLGLTEQAECKNLASLDSGSASAGSSGAAGNFSRLASGENGDAQDAFSSTITINNQSIILTIENGVLTLAAPQEGYAYKDEGMVSLKEHLGMKEHEDIVLLNYDGGTKSIGKISNVPVADRDETSAGQVASDSELTLAEECPLSELPGTTMDPCPSVKQEDGALCAVDESSSLGHGCKRALVGKAQYCALKKHHNIFVMSFDNVH